MKLPNADAALVERARISDYLLDPAHRYGASKTRFFTLFGFRAEAWEDEGQTAPRLITAYPLEASQ